MSCMNFCSNLILLLWANIFTIIPITIVHLFIFNKSKKMVCFDMNMIQKEKYKKESMKKHEL